MSPIQSLDEDLNEWRAYKLEKAIAMVMYEYSLEWTPVESHWMSIYAPGCPLNLRPEIRANVCFHVEPQEEGLHGGRISALYLGETIYSPLDTPPPGPWQRTHLLYGFDGMVKVDHLVEHPSAAALYREIYEELN